MLVAGFNALTSRLADEFKALDVLSYDQANADTPGFCATMCGVRQGLFKSWRDTRQGGLSVTGDRLDVALPDGVFLSVATQGGPGFSRRGDLTVDAQGYLALGSGNRVLDESGKPLHVGLGSKVWLDDKGTVRVGNKTVGVLGRYRVSSVVARGGCLAQAAPGALVTADNSPVRVGALEQSNVNEARVMSRLVSLTNRSRVLARSATLVDATVQRALTEMTGGR